MDNENFEEISPISNENIEAEKPKKSKKSKVIKIILIALIALICIIAAIIAAVYAITYNTIEQMEREPLDVSDLGITSEVQENKKDDDIRNIALFGIDSRKDNDVGRSDATMVLTIDKRHNKIKLTSIARDSYVLINGRQDKLTHAYAYGKAQLAVKTINQNYGLNITDYVSVNFFGIQNIVDYIGGITVNLTQREVDYLNRITPKEERLSGAGPQRLNGKLALEYSRIRYLDSDLERTNRQKKVLVAMLNQVKTLNPLELPQTAEKLMKECKTSIATSDVISMGTWVLTTAPEVEQLNIPNEYVKSSGKKIRGVWYYVYDINAAKADIQDFINETNRFARFPILNESNVTSVQ